MLDFTRRGFMQLGAAAAASFAGRTAGAQQAYDDGGPIPPAVSGPLTRVVVVGAGLAGLTVANAMKNAGKQVVVVEGRDRVGGRMETRLVGGIPFDLGAAWIHGPIGNPVSDFASQVGVTTTPLDLETEAGAGRFTGYDPLIGSLSAVDTQAAFGAAADFLFELPALRAQLGAGASVDAGIIAHLNNEGFTGDTRRVVDFLIRSALVEQTYAGSASDLSLDWYFEDLAFGGGDVVPDGGMTQLAEAMAEQVDVRLNETVTDIAYDGSGVVVTTSAGTHTGSHAVVTIPLGVLQSGAPTFTPALPTTKTDAIAALGMGSLEKIVLRYPNAFWRTALPVARHYFYLSSNFPSFPSSLEYPFFLDWTSIAGSPALVCAVSADFAASLSLSPGMSDAQIMTRIGAIQDEIFGVATTEAPTHFEMSRWETDPFSLGAYSYIPVGSSPADMDTLGDPVGGRVLFAGEATNSNYYGTLHGAMLSGIREGKRLLQSAAVLLPEPRFMLPIAAAGLIALAKLRARLPSADTPPSAP